jgi:hypothetical protein
VIEMSKTTITRLFVGAVLAVVIGLVVALAALVTALAAGAVAIGGPTVITVNGTAIAGTLGWLVLGAVAIATGALAAIASWIGALLNTVQLQDKTWFFALLVLGLCSFGWLAMAAYVLAGPDATKADVARPGAAPAVGA